MTPGTPAGARARPLMLRRTFASPRDEVFRAWTDPDALPSWWGGALGKTLSAAIDLRVGGAYRFTMQSGPEIAVLEGVYREVEPPARLVYTWRWDRLDIDGGRQSLVTVEFHERGEATEVVVTHEGVEESLAFHEGGWTASLERLGEVVPPGGRAERSDILGADR